MLTLLDIKILDNKPCRTSSYNKIFPQSHFFEFKDCRNITDEGLTALANLTQLTSLNLTDCRDITDEGLTAIAQNCTNLNHVDLSFTNITDKGRTAVAQA